MRKVLFPNCKDKVFHANNYSVGDKSKNIVPSPSGVTSFQSRGGSISNHSFNLSKIHWNPNLLTSTVLKSSKRKSVVSLDSMLSEDGGYFSSKLGLGLSEKMNKSIHESDIKQEAIEKVENMKNELIEKDILIAELKSDLSRLRKRLHRNSLERDFYACKCYFRALRKHHRHSCKYASRLTSKRPIITWKPRKSLKK